MNCYEAWEKIIKEILKEGQTFTDASNKQCIELLNSSIQMKNVEDYKKPIEKMIRKADFVYPKIEQMENLILLKNNLNNFASRMQNFEGKNQLYDFIIPLLKKDQNTRRAVMITYNPKEDSTLQNKTTISMLTFFFRIRNKKLHLSVFIRSLDCFIGLPANLVQVATIQTEVAKHLGIECGSITFFAGSAHVYKDNLSSIEKVLGIK